MLVYVDAQEYHDKVKRNHGKDLLSVRFGRCIYEKRPPEDSPSGLEYAFSKKVNLHFQRDFFSLELMNEVNKGIEKITGRRITPLPEHMTHLQFFVSTALRFPQFFPNYVFWHKSYSSNQVIFGTGINVEYLVLQ